MTTPSVDCKTLRISEPQTGKSNASCKLERMVAPPGSRVLEEKVESLWPLFGILVGVTQNYLDQTIEKYQGK